MCSTLFVFITVFLRGGEEIDTMCNFKAFFNYWDTLIEEWYKDPDKVIKKNVYLSNLTISHYIYVPGSNKPTGKGTFKTLIESSILKVRE